MSEFTGFAKTYQIDKLDRMTKQIETILSPIKFPAEEMSVNILPPVTKTILANPLLSYLDMGEAITEKIISMVINGVMKYYKSRPLTFLSILDKRVNTVLNSRSHIRRIFSADLTTEDIDTFRRLNAYSKDYLFNVAKTPKEHFDIHKADRFSRSAFIIDRLIEVMNLKDLGILEENEYQKTRDNMLNNMNEDREN